MQHVVEEKEDEEEVVVVAGNYTRFLHILRVCCVHPLGNSAANHRTQLYACIFCYADWKRIAFIVGN